MKTLNFFIAIVLTASFISCKKDSKKKESRQVKYEISGNYTGKLNIVYTGANGAAETLMGISLPWNKEVTVQESVGAVTLNVSTSSTSTVGVSGQTATAKIMVGGQQKQSATKTADASGHIQFNSMTFYY